MSSVNKTQRTTRIISITLTSVIVIVAATKVFWARHFIYERGYQLADHFPFEILLNWDVAIAGCVLAGLGSIVLAVVARSATAALAATAAVALAVFGFFHTYYADYPFFLAGARDRLQVEIDPDQLQSWALGVMPAGPVTKGKPIHLINGQTITPGDFNDQFYVYEDGGFDLPPKFFPPKLQKLFSGKGARAEVHTSPGNKFVSIGFCGSRFGLCILIGDHSYVAPDGGTGSTLRWKDGIYLQVGSPG